MHPLPTRLMRPTWALLLVAAALGSSPALAAGKRAQPEAQARYQHDLAQCRSPERAADRADCLREARAAYAEAQPERADPDPGRYLRNALKRCEPLTEPDRGDCVARIQGQGTRSGSVSGGGIYRELVTREIGSPGAVPAAPVVPAK